MTKEEAYNILYCLLKEATKTSHIEALTIAIKDIVALEKAKEGYDKILSALNENNDIVISVDLIKDIVEKYINDIN